MRYRSSRFYMMIISIALIAVLGSAYYVSPVRSQQGAYFSDQFNMNAYDWTPTGGNWAVVNGEYTQTIDPSSDEYWSVAGSISWFDYMVETKVYSIDKSDDGEGYFTLAGRWADENNYYGLKYSDTGTPESAQLALYKKVNGVSVPLTTWYRSTDSRVPYIGEGAAGVTGNPYPVVLKMKFLGSNIEVYVNDEKIGSSSDTSLYYGKIALGQKNRQVYFDDVYVWDVTPPVLHSITVPDNVGNAISLQFSTDEYSSYRVDYGTTASYGLSKITTVRQLSHNVDIAGLTPNTTYHYKVTVIDAGGNSTSSEDRTITTGPIADVTAPTVNSITYGDITAGSAVIYWTSSEPGNSIIDYGTSPGSYQYSLSYDEKTTAHAVYLSRLDGKTKYYFKVKTRDIASNLGVSTEYVFETLKNLKPRINKVVTGSTPTVNLTVYWKGIPEAARYRVYVSSDNDWSVEDAVIDETGQSQYWFNKESLVANNNYYIKVLAEDAVADSAFTVAKAFPPDANPHGYYWDNPDLCENCHATHKADGPRLLREVNADRLCLTCHDGTGSKYNVLSGKFKGLDAAMYPSVAGPYGSLEGITVEEQAYVTSRHDLDIFIYAATGNNIENLETADSHLSCSSCHDPHGNENYRNLRQNMRVSSDPSIPLIQTEAYSVTATTYEQPVYVRGAVEFCGSCHSDFNQSAGASRTARITTDQPGLHLASASLYKYMHPVNIDAQFVSKTAYAVPVPTYLPYENGRIICQTCHFTHGTMNQGTHNRRDGYPSTVLKRFDQTVGCEDCHDKTDHPD